MLFAAQLIWDGKTLAGVIKAVREVEFDRLRDAEGYVLTGLKADGRTPREFVAGVERRGDAGAAAGADGHGGIRSPRLNEGGHRAGRRGSER